MQVEFKTKKYDLADGGIHHTYMSDGANILTIDVVNVESIDELITEATDCDKITVYDGESVDAVYEDYVNFQNIVTNGDYVEVTVSQPSMVQQVVLLKNKIAEQQEVINIQAAHIADLESSQKDQDDQITEIQEVLVEDL